VSLALVVVVMAVEGIAPSPQAVTFPIWLALLVIAALGVGLTSSALMVRYRDVQYVLPFAIQLMLFVSPVAYPLSAVPAGSHVLFELNPLTGLLEGFRWSVLGTPAPSAPLTVYAAVSSFIVFAAGSMIFNRTERGFADVI
jgi:lipopolysaccharide transport system permease protein